MLHTLYQDKLTVFAIDRPIPAKQLKFGAKIDKIFNGMKAPFV
jgi:hypothetical protein